ncbi:MAG: twitching motility protein PilT [Lachnospiraceae bacterium]|nr:twitching motility protein PilT [Lachnospiraceae bacterium]
MVQIIAGKKGKGKTKYLLAGANEAVDTANGSIVYIDKNGKHMYELSNKVRLINVAEFPIRSYNAFVGFICGIISQDHDIEVIFLDSFLTVAHLEEAEDLSQAIADFDGLGEKYGIRFVLSVSRDSHALPENAADKIMIAL